jgi:NADPH:quinone reductase-like Zn-dependent oxidoreductase
MKAIELHAFGLENFKLVDRDEPLPGPHEVVVGMRAASLNYRDLLFAKGLYNPRAKLPAVPLSDGAGEVVAVGEKVTRWRAGDRVCPIFMQDWVEGRRSAAKDQSALGAGDRDGVLRERAVFAEHGLVRIPEHLSFAEAATLPCAAVTAWHALIEAARIKPGQTVLTLGTGGVSVFAVQFAKLAGARVIATSSSDDKLARIRQLGADETINYRQTPAWEKEVLRLTGGLGVDAVVEVGGAGTLPKSIACTRTEGTVAVIGVLASGEGVDPTRVLMKSLRLHGIYVGSAVMFEAMNAAICASKLQPIIDRTFPFSAIREALAHLESGAHFGKVVLTFP